MLIYPWDSYSALSDLELTEAEVVMAAEAALAGDDDDGMGDAYDWRHAGVGENHAVASVLST